MVQNNDLNVLQANFDEVKGEVERVLPKEQQKIVLENLKGIIDFLTEDPSDTSIKIASQMLEAIHISLEQTLRMQQLAKYQLERGNKFKQESAHYKALSETDPLTKLPSRHGFNIQLDKAIALNGTDVDPINEPNAKKYFGLMIMDFDRFKGVNDTKGLGHPAGDQALRVFGEHLLFHTRTETDLDDVRGTAARLGGDEFTLIVETEAKSPEQARDVLKLAHDRIRERFTGLHAVFEDKVIPIVVSSGFHIIEEDDTALSAYKSADAALDDFKNSNPARKAERYEAAVQELRDRGLENIVYVEDLRAAASPAAAKDNTPEPP